MAKKVYGAQAPLTKAEVTALLSKMGYKSKHSGNENKVFIFGITYNEYVLLDLIPKECDI
jgi:hypothetical protein